MLLPALILSLTSPKLQTSNFQLWGLEVVEQMVRELKTADGKLFAEDATPPSQPTQPAFTWGVGVALSALNSAAQVDKRFKPELSAYVDNVKVYWNAKGPVPGFDVLPNAQSIDRYYDDNEWLVLGLAESSKVLKSKPALDWAKKTQDYVMSGEDRMLDGGVYWREAEKYTKNTCSNGPAAASAIALYEATKDLSYLHFAERIYGWTRTRLRDPKDGLYWDNISVEGMTNRTKWSYNTGLMLRTAAELFRITKREEYAADVREMQASSLRYWISPNGAFKDEGKFAHLLLENWLLAYRNVPTAEDPRAAITQCLAWLHEHNRDAHGHYGSRWDREVPSTVYSKIALIDQASVARALLIAAQYKL